MKANLNVFSCSSFVPSGERGNVKNQLYFFVCNLDFLYETVYKKFPFTQGLQLKTLRTSGG